MHIHWLDRLRKSIWDRICFEDEMIPSIEALKCHWMRSCWVIHIWSQAQENHMELLPLHENGWIVRDDELSIDWDSSKNIKAV